MVAAQDGNLEYNCTVRVVGISAFAIEHVDGSDVARGYVEARSKEQLVLDLARELGLRLGQEGKLLLLLPHGSVGDDSFVGVLFGRAEVEWAVGEHAAGLVRAVAITVEVLAHLRLVAQGVDSDFLLQQRNLVVVNNHRALARGRVNGSLKKHFCE